MVEPLGVVLAEQLEALALVGGEMGIVGVGFGAEEIGAVGAHFVQVHVDQREPLAQGFHLVEDLGLGERNPVAVQIEEVVVDAPAGPRLEVLGGHRAGVRLEAPRLLEVVHEAVAAVGILDGIDKHQHVGQNLVHQLVVARGEQVVSREQAGVGRGKLVAMHAVGKPDHRGQPGHDLAGVGLRSFARVGDALHLSANLGEPADIGFRPHGRVDELASLPGLAVVEHLEPVGCG